jgi:MFS family permease
MESSTNAEQQDRESVTEPYRRVIDWVVAGLLVLAGLLAGAVGALVTALANRDDIAAAVADGTLQSTELTDAELVDVTYAFLWWGGVGLAVAGLLLVLAGLGFLAFRRRQARRRRESGEAGPDALTDAIVGAAVTALTAFVPFSPVLGGGLAAYIHRGNRRAGAKVGGLSGLVASVPVVVLFVFLTVGFGLAAADLGLGLLAVAVGAALVAGLVGTVVYMVVLGAVGGYLGVALTEKRDGPVDAESA